MYTTLEDVLSALVSAVEDESAALWAQGDVLRDACHPITLRVCGVKDQETLLKEAGKAIGRGRRTMYSRLATSRVFPDGKRNAAVSWAAHSVCAGTIDPDGWLIHAAEQHLSVDQLRAAIKAANGELPGNVTLVYFWRAGDAVIESVDGQRVTLLFDSKPLAVAREGASVAVTVVEAVQAAAQKGMAA